MLKAGANPKAAWGTPRTGPKESFWQTSSGPSRRVLWVTPGGVSTTPAAFAHAAPVPVSNAPLLFTFLNGNTQVTFVILATDGSSMIASDYMIAITPPSP